MSGEYRVGPVDDPDRYELGTAVASGAEGILYRGTITTSGGLVLDVAIKVLQPRFGGQVDAWHARWSEQLELLRSLHVPGVVAVRDGFLGVLPHPIGQAPPAGRNLYLVMNWVEGEALDEWVARRPERDVVESLKMLIAVGAALDVMHSGQMTGGVPVVHRDVKPANILVTPAGTVLVDFGMTRGLPTGSRQSGVTGTPGYIAPESIASGDYSPASDRYALGCVAYFVITGDEPPHRPDPAAMRARLAAVPALSGRPQVVDMVMSMLADHPADRPAHAANWLARVRGSSLSELPVIPGLTAPGQTVPRQPVPGQTVSEPATAVAVAEIDERRSTRWSAGFARRALLPVSAIAAMVLVAIGLQVLPPDPNDVTAAAMGRSTTNRSAGAETATSTSLPSGAANPAPGGTATTRPGPTTSSPSPTVTVPSPGPTTPPTLPPVTDPARPRAKPAITARNESYEIEVIGEFQRYTALDMFAYVRRTDLKKVWGEDPDGYGSTSGTGWQGTFGRRCLTVGGTSNMSVPGEPLHLYAFGVVGLDAVKVELVWDDGRRVEADLGAQTFAVPVRWWIAPYASANPDKTVATDAAGGTWLIGADPIVHLMFGQVGC